jgi:hypothetical protein
MLPAMAKGDVRIVQTCYPQIYLACHIRTALRGLALLASAAREVMRKDTRHA